MNRQDLIDKLRELQKMEMIIERRDMINEISELVMHYREKYGDDKFISNYVSEYLEDRMFRFNMFHHRKV